LIRKQRNGSSERDKSIDLVKPYFSG